MLPMYPTESELPKYPTEVEPAIWLQLDEEVGHGDCGCNVAQQDGARLNYCTMHAAAPELLEALERVMARNIYHLPIATVAAKEDARALLQRLRGERAQ